VDRGAICCKGGTLGLGDSVVEMLKVMVNAKPMKAKNAI
jgi:hypothetical protein